jgi:hypothetical protein
LALLGVVCAASLAAEVISYRRMIFVHWRQQPSQSQDGKYRWRTGEIGIAYGSLRCDWGTAVNDYDTLDTGVGTDQYQPSPSDAIRAWFPQHLGFWYRRDPRATRGWSTELAVPLWLVTAVCSIPPVLAMRRSYRTRRRRRSGECIICGYDLRETPSRCPECGWAPDLVKRDNPPLQRTATAGTSTVQ